jgi:hypothetical protein
MKLPTPPADLVKGLSPQQAKVLLQQLQRYENNPAELLMERPAPNPEQAALLARHVEALHAELLVQEKKEAELN